ncbi:MAG: HD domain-containing protein [Salinivirgaceae bacterium]|jgi:adenylate cyclase|nr:HD domain-containing protein [Salinivirgaceae bacterium]
MNTIGIKTIHFNIIKKHFLLLFALVFLTIFQIQSNNTQPQSTPLLNKIIVNDTIIFNANTIQEGKITIKKNLTPRLFTIWIDSGIIKQHQLNEFRFFLEKSKNNTVNWIPYPYKEFSRIKGNSNVLIIEARNSKNEMFTNKVLIELNGGEYNTTLAWLLYILLFIVASYLIYAWASYRLAREKYLLETEISNRTKELSEQKAKYEEMLTNYLPKEDFEKLKEQSKDKTERFKMVTVLFSNILGFTKVADQENAEQLIDDVDKFNFHFDEVVHKLHIEKIKSIGDSYMCAGGIPQKNRTNPIEVVLAAFEMQQYMQSIKDQYVAKNKKIWDLRMGIHTGPVFSNSATNKKRLEIWGDTVNIASRMEASGEIGKVNITGMTYELVKDYFLCQYRGKMPVKYKGEIDMYFIEGFRPALSIDGFGIKPNKTFTIRLGLIRFDDLEEHVMNILEDKLPRNLHYHNLKHTIDVTVQVEIIGRHEGISDEEMLLLKTAALFHDTGFTSTYKDHEEVGVVLAKEILPNYDYTEEQIEKISDLIMVTKLPPKPTNLLEEIMCDADLDYLGRVDFIPVSGNLFTELTEHKIIENDINHWNQLQISFISNHQYFTETAKKLRDVNKNNQLEAIRKLVKENS